MAINKIKALYVDDNIDNYLTEFLYNNMNKYCEDSVEVDYGEFPITDENISDLLKNITFQETDIFFLDSRLYENNSRNDHSFSGESLKMFLEKNNAFKKIFIISKNEDADAYKDATIKYSPQTKDLDDEEHAFEYYEKTLLPKIKDGIESILDSRKMYENEIEGNDKFNNNPEAEKIKKLLDGDSSYTQLTGQKIDELIDLVKSFEKDI